MRIVYARCCGLDVHKKSISACLLTPDEMGGTRQEVRRFGAMTRDLLLLSDWLAANQVTHVAMESTGVYWKPVWNILEEHYTILLVNAQHVKAVPGRKTDTKDCQWIADLDTRIQDCMCQYQKAVELCTTVPGIEAVAAANIIAEIGVNMEQFPSPSTWQVGLACVQATNESAGKRLSGKARNGCVWVRRSLCQAAWAASQSKNTYLSAQFRRLAARKGKKRAIVAVAHTILIILFHMLKNQQPYRDLGADYFDRRNAEQLKRSLIRRLERLGLQVTVQSPISSAINTA